MKRIMKQSKYFWLSFTVCTGELEFTKESIFVNQSLAKARRDAIEHLMSYYYDDPELGEKDNRSGFHDFYSFFGGSVIIRKVAIEEMPLDKIMLRLLASTIVSAPQGWHLEPVCPNEMVSLKIETEIKE